MSKNNSRKNNPKRASYNMIDPSLFEIKNGKLIKKEDADSKKTKG